MGHSFAQLVRTWRVFFLDNDMKKFYKNHILCGFKTDGVIGFLKKAPFATSFGKAANCQDIYTYQWYHIYIYIWVQGPD